MVNAPNTVQIARILRRLDSELSADDAEYVARHVYGPIRTPDPQGWLAVRLDQKPDHHTWGTIGDLMWQAWRILQRLNKQQKGIGT